MNTRKQFKLKKESKKLTTIAKLWKQIIAANLTDLPLGFSFSGLNQVSETIKPLEN